MGILERLNLQLRLLEAILPINWAEFGILRGKIQHAIGSESTSPARFGPRCNKKEKTEKNTHGRAKWEGGMRGAYRCRAYGQSGKTRAQHASNRLLKTSSDGESITSCGSLFHSETTRAAKECALSAVNAVGFNNVRECPLRLHGGLRVKTRAWSRRTVESLNNTPIQADFTTIGGLWVRCWQSDDRDS